LNASNTQGAGTVACTLAGYGVCRVGMDALAELRRLPGLPCGEPLPATFLKHADEQTVVALVAVFEAIRAHGLAPAGAASPFRDWGVLAAPRFLGRPTMTSALPRFQIEGAWGVSPHVVPHRSLHSPSGTISQALKIHGPNFGVAGGPGNELEGLLAGVVLLHDMHLPGVWVAFSRLEPESDSDSTTGRAGPGVKAVGLALALTPLASFAGRPVLELTLKPGGPPAPAFTLAVLEEVLAGLATPVGEGHARAESGWVVPLGTVGQLVLRRRGSALPGPHPPFFAAGAAAVPALTQPGSLSSQRSDQP
jgi:hypothetical protein